MRILVLVNGLSIIVINLFRMANSPGKNLESSINRTSDTEEEYQEDNMNTPQKERQVPALVI